MKPQLDSLSPVAALEDHLRMIEGFKGECARRLAKWESELEIAEAQVRGEKLEMARLDAMAAETQAAIRKIGGAE